MADLVIPLDCKSLKEHSRTIIHIDIDCFYAQVEMLRNPELRDKPLGIQQKNIVVTCNYVAREFGVGKLMSLKDAYKCCPGLVLISGEDLTNYRATSAKVTELLQARFSPAVERLGFDENFIDVTQLVANKASTAANKVEGHIYGGLNEFCECGCSQRLVIGSHIAADMRQNIYDEFELTTCAGISYNKILAKLVGAKHKPNQQTTLFHDQVLNFINNLPSIRSIPGIGRQTADLLKHKLSVDSVANLQLCSLDQLKSALASEDVARTVQKLSFGIDDAEVKSSGKPQSIGLEDAFKEVRTLMEAQQRLSALLERLLELLASQNDERTPATLRVSVRKYHKAARESQRESRQSSLPCLPSAEQVDKCKDKLMPLVMELFLKMVNPSERFHLTLLGMAFCNFNEPPKRGKASILTFLEPASKKPKFAIEDRSISQMQQQQGTLATGIEASTSLHSTLPPSVDPEVFYQLPSSLQQEILDDWEQQQRERNQQQKVKEKPKNSIERYFKKNKK